MKARLAGLACRLRRRARRAPAGGSELRGIAYWEWRARRYGARAVLHLGHGESEIAEVTRRHSDRVLAVLRRHLRGDERLALDFGCGIGRMTRLLAEAIDGRAVGVDPVAALLALAPEAPEVEYRALRDGCVPLEAGSADAVLVCLVLGGITERADLARAAREIGRVLRPGGLLVLVENTAERADLPHWCYRPAASYAALFPEVALVVEDAYEDLGERIEILAGRSGGEAGGR